MIDTHVHASEVSPYGKVPAKKMVNLYKKAGYDGIVITDAHHPQNVARGGVIISNNISSSIELAMWIKKTDNLICIFPSLSSIRNV